MNRTRNSLAALAALFASSLAIAAAATPDFAKADANGDGSVDSAEFAATGIEKKFKGLDTNGDGKLSKTEYSAALEEDCE